jgi:hypothetical protein
MTYEDTAALAADPDYGRRLAACVVTESLGKPGDQLADDVIRNGPGFAVNVFGPTVASAPGFGDKYAAGGAAGVTDPDLLSAVQASWERLAAVYAPAATP